jgi:endonuclease YncB( thermonuclease family)
MRYLIRYFLTLLVAVHYPPAPVWAKTLQGQVSVIDGDTIDLHTQRIRLHAVDAPESGQVCLDASQKSWRCGQQAANALSDFIGQSTVACQQTDTDHYGRLVATCTARNTSLNAWLVANGWAVAYRQYGGHLYSSQEQSAKVRKIGIWRGKFDIPSDWRRGKRQATSPKPAPVRKCSVSKETPCNAVELVRDADIKKLMIRQSMSGYPGNCPCPYNRDRAGRNCGGRSAYARRGGYAPLCYQSDISQEAVEQFKGIDRKK